MIQAGDIKLFASQVMLDVPEGGGQPSGTVINDGTSNGIFPDISELDRAGGRVNLRKTFASVYTTNTDGYFGANVIVAEPPEDPLVSVTLFSTEDVFDRRDAAKSRMEAYLAQGGGYSGLLFGNHLAGMRTVTILQREEAAVPVIGDTIMLRAFEGTGSQVEQYVRATDVADVVRTFADDEGEFKRRQVTLDISDALRSDYPGFEAVRKDASINYTGKTRLFSTIVADAARYYGVVPLEVAAEIGDFTVKGESIFSQLVPSTRIEVPIADARMNQQLSALVPAGDAFTRTITATFTTTQALYIGGTIMPGSLSIARGGVTLTDRGGILLDTSGAQAGLVDYDNGVLTLNTNIFGASSGSHEVTYTPATTPVVVSEAIGLKVEIASQRLSWVVTLEQIPAKRSLQISYRALGRWYVLTEDGSGAIRGSDASFGAGTLNYTTGTVTVTLGALPDIDTRIIFTWAPAVVSRPVTQVAAPGPTLTPERAFGKVFQMPGSIKPGTLSITWNDGTARSATDSSGLLSGDATGTVDYGSGRVYFRPTVLPAKNTTINIEITEAVRAGGAVSAFTDSGGHWSFNIGATNVKARSVSLGVAGQYAMTVFPGVDEIKGYALLVFDDGLGNLQVANTTSNLTVGTINYVTGACTLNKTINNYKSVQPAYTKFAPLGASGDPSSYIKITSYYTRDVTLALLNGPGVYSISTPPWAWWSGGVANAAETRYAAADGSVQTFALPMDELFIPLGRSAANGSGALLDTNIYNFRSFSLGSLYYQRIASSTEIITNINPNTGLGTVAGIVSSVGNEAGVVLNEWVAGSSSVPTGFTASTTPAVSGSTTPLLVDSVTFRTAVSPLINSGFSIAGTWRLGATFTASPNSAGIVKTGSNPPDADSVGTLGVFGFVDYETGVIDLRFGRAAGASLHTDEDVIDISELNVPGVTHIKAEGVQADTLRYNAVGYAYLPLDPDILGLDPVRLPADGRVPIFRVGSFAVIGHTGTVGPVTVSNGQTINCARVRLSRVRVIGNNGLVINTGYTADLDAGLVTFTDVGSYSQPVTVEHRIEDMMLVSDTQINGQMSFTRPVTHDYPVPGSYISSALVAGDLTARVSLIFDQATWNGTTWQDAVSGSPSTGTYNDVLSPIEVTNRGALTERWAVQFTNSTSFNVIGEHVGVIAVGNTSTDCAPLNPATGTPYFTLRAAGWGLGWATGNILRFNTVGAFYPVWMARTILQGPETVPDDSFTVLIRGDVDRP